MWSVLFLTLPTQPSAVRLRIWRALKGLGSGSLRDGVHLLPRARAGLFGPLVDEVRAHGGQASVFELDTPDELQRQEVLALFDRSTAYAQWRTEAQALMAALPGLAEVEARRRLRGVADALETLVRTDFYPGSAAAQAHAEMTALRLALEASHTRGEPAAQFERALQRLDPREFLGKRWATRARPRVDRLACAWLIRRFIDPRAQFLWLADPAQAPRGALGFDHDGARFTHVGARVSVEVLMASFALEGDARLRHIGQVVHYLDVGGIPVPEAAGLDAVLAGLREVHTDDDALLDAAAAVFDALYAAPGTPA